MKKKLEAELISIAHRILKLKNRNELDVLQQETLKLYEKISVLRFVEDNFNDVKPTIGYASAEETLEEIYGIEETPVVHANEQEAEEDKAREEKKAEAKGEEAKEDKPQPTSEEEEADGSDQSSDETRNTQPETEEPVTDEPEGDADPEQEVEEYQASEEEKEHTEEETDEDVEESQEEEPKANSDEPQEDETSDEETLNAQPETENNPQPETEEPEISAQPEIEKSDEDVKAMEDGAAAVYKKEDDSTLEEEEQAADAEVITIAPDTETKVEDFKVDFEFAFERKPAPEEKQKEITFEDYKDYKEPEFVKKGEASEQSQSQSQDETPDPQPETPNATRDWRDWEPAKEEEKPQATSQQPTATSIQSQSQSAEPTRNPQPATGSSRALTLGLNDRIAFEKNLFGGSGEDLNRVVSQLNTFDSFDEAKEFIADMVKPDYNNWQGKEEYEERFMTLVEKKFD